MTVTLAHSKVDGIADDPADALAGRVLPSDWNDNHDLVGGTTGAVLFEDAGSVAEAPSEFIWNNTVKYLHLDATNTDNTGIITAPAPGILTLERNFGGSVIAPYLEAKTTDTGGIWNRFTDGLNTVTWQFGLSLINGAGSLPGFWFFQELGGGNPTDQGTTPLALWLDGSGNSYVGTNANGVFNWNADPAYGGPPGTTGATVDTGLSRVITGVVGIGNGAPGDFTGGLKCHAATLIDGTASSFVTLLEISGKSPVTQWTDSLSVDWQLGPFKAVDNSYGFYNYQPSSNAGWSVFSDGSGANSNTWVAVGADGAFGWASVNGNPSRLGNIDTGLSRGGSKIVTIGSATPGDFSGTAKMTNLHLAPVLISALPAGGLGDFAVVSDGDAALAAGATVVNSGAGATPYAVWNNGTNWTVLGF